MYGSLRTKISCWKSDGKEERDHLVEDIVKDGLVVMKVKPTQSELLIG